MYNPINAHRPLFTPHSYPISNQPSCASLYKPRAINRKV